MGFGGGGKEPDGPQPKGEGLWSEIEKAEQALGRALRYTEDPSILSVVAAALRVLEPLEPEAAP